MFALAAMLAAIFDIAHLVGIAAAKHLVHETVIVAGIVTRMDVFEPVPVIDKDLFEDVPALSRFDNHQVAPSEGGWDMLRVQLVYHVSPAPSNPLIGLLSATAWKCTKMGKMKMVRFSGIKFAMGLAYETHNPLPSHEIRRKRIRRQIFSTDAKKKIVRFQTAGIDTVSGHR